MRAGEWVPTLQLHPPLLSHNRILIMQSERPTMNERRLHLAISLAQGEKNNISLHLFCLNMALFQSRREGLCTMACTLTQPALLLLMGENINIKREKNSTVNNNNGRGKAQLRYQPSRVGEFFYPSRIRFTNDSK